MAQILPDGTIRMSDGRVLGPGDPAPQDRVFDFVGYPRIWSAKLREMAEHCRAPLARRRIGMVGNVYSVGPRSGEWWFSVRSDLYSQTGITVLVRLRAGYQFTQLTLSLLALKEPEHYLVDRHSSLEKREIDRMLAEVDLEAIEEPLARAVKLRLPAPSPKHWLPAGKADRR